MAERVEVKSQGVSTEVRATTRQHMMALEERERDLLRRIEIIRQVKGKSLHLQVDDLKTGLTSLLQTVSEVEGLLTTGTKLDILRTRDKMVNEMQKVRQLDPFTPTVHFILVQNNEWKSPLLTFSPLQTTLVLFKTMNGRVHC